MMSYIIYNMEMRKVNLDMSKFEMTRTQGDQPNPRLKGWGMQMGRKWIIAMVGLMLLMALGAQAAFAQTVCQLGDTGEKVRAVQTRLYTLGYLSEAPESPYKFTATTKTAVKKFQSASNLSVSGTVDEDTYRLLTLSTALTYDQYKDAIHVPGGSGDEVKATKTRLKKLGYYTGALNIRYDAATEAAVAYFQRAHSLSQTGRADTATRSLLFSERAMTVQDYKDFANLSVVKKGDNNDQVEAVQLQLYRLGYYDGTMSGSFDAGTVTAVKLFQSANGLKSSGVADEMTRSLLNAGTGKSYEEYKEEQALLEVSKGDKGFSVTLLQERLTELAFYSGAVSGKYSQAVVESVKRFQIANAVNNKGAKHGVATTATRQVMNGSEAISRYDSEGLLPGDDLAAVSEMTQELKNLGYLSGTTSKYSSAVTAAVKIFQNANKLTASGNATPETLKLLYSGEALSYDEFKNGSGNARIEKVITVAMAQLGKPYKSPCSAPGSFDCSNYTKYCFNKGAGITLPGEVTTQGNTCKKKYTVIKDMNDLKRGDLLFFDTQDSKPIGHSAIYLGKSNGSPRFIHASSAAGKVVVTVFKDWYQERFLFGARLIK